MQSRSVYIFITCILVAVGYSVALVLLGEELSSQAKLANLGQLFIIPLLVGLCSSLLASWLLQEERNKFIEKIRNELFKAFDHDRKETQEIINEVLDLLQQGKLNQTTARQELIPRLHEADKALSKNSTAEEFLRSLDKNRS